MPKLLRTVATILFCVGLTSVAVRSQDDSVRIYPQFAIGGGFQVVLVLTNASAEPFSGTLLLPEFGDGSGRRWLVNGEERTGSDRMEVALAARQTERFVFSAPEGAEAAAGAMQLEAAPGSSLDTLAVSFFYEFRTDGELVDNVGVPPSGAAFRYVLPVERSADGSTVTGVAVRQRVDSEGAPAGGAGEPIIVVTLYDQSGNTLAQAFGPLLGARFFDELFAADTLPAGDFTGSLAVESESSLYLVALRMQRQGAGRFQLTGVPAFADTSTPATFNARYQVTFDATWSASTHPVDFPFGPHFSPLIGGVHNASVTFWEPGQEASVGIEQMAELGATAPLSFEVMGAIDSGAARSVVRGGGVGLSPGSVSTEFVLDQQYPLITLVTMVAPSPDWFVGVRGLNLFVNGQWVDQLVVSLDPYDAGTDSGTTYNSPNADTQPREPITRITGFPFLNGSVVQPMGTFTFTRIDGPAPSSR